MNKENDWDHMKEASKIEEPIKNVAHEEMEIEIEVMKPEKAAGPSEVCEEMICASGEVGVSVMMKLCQPMLNAKEMPDKSKKE